MEQASFDRENGEIGRNSGFENGLRELQKNKSKGKKTLIAIMTSLVLIGAGAAYFLYFNNGFYKIDDGVVAIEARNSDESLNSVIDKTLDTDKDDLLDYIEKILGTNQDVSDTDGDSYNDLAEIKSGYDPLKSIPDQKLSNNDWNAIKDKIKNTNGSLYESIFVIPSANSSFVCGTSTVKDVGNNTYNTVKIGDQCWLKENLKVTKNPAGVAITRYCYNNDPKICDTDGGLYDWNTTMNNTTTEGAQGICPNNWHVPKDSEWYALENGLKDSGQTCNANREAQEDCIGAGTELRLYGSSGFAGVLAGLRFTDGSFGTRTDNAAFWTSTENGNNAWSRALASADYSVGRGATPKVLGISVRCLKN